MPANVIVVFRGFSEVINLDVIDKQALYDFTLGRFVPNKIIESDLATHRMLSAQSSGVSTLETLGYAFSNFSRDLLLAVLVITAFLVLILVVIMFDKSCSSKLPPILKRNFDSVKALLMWDKVLTWTTETYLSTAIGTLYAVKTLTRDSYLAFKIVVPA